MIGGDVSREGRGVGKLGDTASGESGNLVSLVVEWVDVIARRDVVPESRAMASSPVTGVHVSVFPSTNGAEAEPSQQNVVWTLAALPWSFKLVYGFISDNFPICGMRRKPYFILGWGTFVAVYLKIASADGPR